jgi:hypothetical protein
MRNFGFLLAYGGEVGKLATLKLQPRSVDMDQGITTRFVILRLWSDRRMEKPFHRKCKILHSVKGKGKFRVHYEGFFGIALAACSGSNLFHGPTI